MIENFGEKILRSIIKRRYFIILFTLTCVLFCYIVTQYFIKHKYALTQVIYVSPIDMKSGINTNSINFEDQKVYSSVLYDKMLGVIINSLDYPKLDNLKVLDMIYSHEFKEKFQKRFNVKNLNYRHEIIKDSENINIIFEGRDSNILYNGKMYFKDLLLELVKYDAKKKLESIRVKAEKGMKIEEKILSLLLSKINKENISLDKVIGEGLNHFENTEFKNSNPKSIFYLSDYLISKETYEAYKLIMKELSIKQVEFVSKDKIRFYDDDETIVTIFPSVSKNLVLALIFGSMMAFYITIFPILKKEVIL